MTAPQFARGDGPPPGSGGAHEDVFESALRGYDRLQVDERIGSLRSELAAAHSESQRAADGLARERARAEQAEQQLHEIRAQIEHLSEQGGGDSGGYGQRAERLLRMAENEAAETRTAAASEAAAIIEEARGEAEAHRHQVEQELINKAAQQDQEASWRIAVIKEREQETAKERTAAQQEAKDIRESAQREAIRLVQAAEVNAADARREAKKVADQQRDAASREVDRLSGMQNGVRSELSRLHQYLGAEFDDDPDPDAASDTDRASDRVGAAD